MQMTVGQYRRMASDMSNAWCNAPVPSLPAAVNSTRRASHDPTSPLFQGNFKRYPLGHAWQQTFRFPAQHYTFQIPATSIWHAAYHRCHNPRSSSDFAPEPKICDRTRHRALSARIGLKLRRYPPFPGLAVAPATLACGRDRERR